HTRFSRDWSSDVCSSDLWQPGSSDRATAVTRKWRSRQPREWKCAMYTDGFPAPCIRRISLRCSASRVRPEDAARLAVPETSKRRAAVCVDSVTEPAILEAGVYTFSQIRYTSGPGAARAAATLSRRASDREVEKR